MKKFWKTLEQKIFDVAFICVADIEASVMIALNLKELGIKNYYSKSNKQETWKNSYESWSN